MKPLNPKFNKAVLIVADIILPHGFDVTEDHSQVNTLDKIQRYYHEEGKILVSSNNNNNSIYGDPVINMAFRAWHDWLHVTKGCTFTEQGERRTYEQHCRQVDLYLSHMFNRAERAEFKDLLDVEINEQALYNIRTGQFVEDQVSFTIDHMKRKGYNYG